MGFALIIREIFKRPLWIGDKQAKIVALSFNTSPGRILEGDYYPGWHPANKEELESFVRKYHPAFWYPPILGIDPQLRPTIFGPVTQVYKTRRDGDGIEKVEQNLIRGLPAKTLILFVKT